MASDRELLQLQVAWGTDDAARESWSSGVGLGVAEDGVAVRVDGPPAVAVELRAAIGAARPARDASSVPPALTACRRVLERLCPLVQVDSGPSYVFTDVVSPQVDADLRASDGAPGDLRTMNPGTWEPAEWDELLDGVHGPWAMAVSSGRVVSICHTPRPLLEDAAEAGVWTDPAFRGRGLAAAVTAAWARMLAPSGRHLFYSTSGENLSSQRVAQRLGLRPIGWLWSVWCADDVVRDVRARAPEPELVLRLLVEVESWGAQATLHTEGAHRGWIVLQRRRPGDVFLRLLAGERRVVAPGRGGPPRELVLREDTLDDVLALARAAHVALAP